MITLADLSRTAWAIEEKALEALSESITIASGQQVPEPSAMLPPEEPYQLVAAAPGGPESVALIPVHGPILRGNGDRWLKLFGIAHVGQADLHDALSAAAADDRVSSVLLDVDSPGGVAVGMASLASRIADFPKPVEAYVSGMAASAAYYLASQATRITAEPDAIVGSIGAFNLVRDTSAAAAQRGVQVHVLRSGPLKGTGSFGVPVTPEQLAPHQEVVDQLAASFVAAVGQGRRLGKKRIAELATGATWVGTQALSLGLVDAIGTRAAALSHLTKSNHRANGARQEAIMPKTSTGAEAPSPSAASGAPAAPPAPPAPKTPTAATLAELKAIAGEGRASFVLASFEAGLTVQAAETAFLKLQLKEERAARAAAEERAVAPVASNAPAQAAADLLPEQVRGGSTVELEGDFMAQARAYADRQGTSLTEAMSQVATKHPVLHARYVEAQHEWGRKNSTRSRMDRAKSRAGH